MILGVDIDQRAASERREQQSSSSGWASRLTGRVRASPYYPALSHPVLRRVLPGAALSSLGDGMSAVAIAWLALKLAPEASRGLWVGAAVAAYSLPGAAGAVALRRWLHGRGGARLAFINAVLRAAALGLIGCLAIAGLLDPVGYVALLGVSSLVSAWGTAGKYTLIADLLPPATPETAAPGAWAVIRSSPVLPGLLALSFVFYLLYGPVEVALPVHVATDLHGSAALLGAFWAVFGVGAVIGELSAPFLRRWRVWPTMTGIVLGWGLALVPLGLDTPLWVALAAFFTGAVIWGPWMSLSMAVLQDASPPGALAQVIAARSSLLIIASPIGTALGGPIVAALGARGTLLASALGTILLGLITTAVLVPRRKR